jgi:hypothetical protein
LTDGRKLRFGERKKDNMENKESTPDYLLLKWGTFKGGNFENSPEAWAAFEEYEQIGSSASAMMQKDTPRQKELLFIMIDKIKGDVVNDWSGEVYENREDAKKYILEYGLKTSG